MNIPVPGRGGGGGREVFKVYALDRIQQHVLWSRSLTVRFLQVACTISLILAVQALPAVSRDGRGQGFFRTFPPAQKKSEGSLPVRVRGRPLGRAHGLRWLMRVVRLGTTTCTMSTSSTMASCGSRLGTLSTCVPVGASLNSPAGSAFSPVWQLPLGSLSRGLNDLEPPQVHCHGLVNLEPLGYKSHGLVDSVRDGVLLRDPRR